MEAKNTVMSKDESDNYIMLGRDYEDDLKKALEAQAEITSEAVLEEVGKWLNDKRLTSVYDAFMRKFKLTNH